MYTLRNFILGLAVFGLAACSGKEIAGVCKTNADCGDNFYCSADYQCLCRGDNACAADEFCNPQGFCQKRLGCLTDEDCKQYERCQIDTSGKGTCLCTSDQACAQGEFCNSSGICQEKAGCILDSDCGDANSWFCRINTQTKIGECFCKADAACAQGEFCNPKGYCQPDASCASNDDCPAGKLCNTETHECLCDPQTQTGCKSGEVCNSAGYCQPRPGCYDNSDCENTPGTFCDLTTRTCIAIGTCTSDLQCELGQICRNNACVAGCNFSYDCPLNQCCVQFQCQSCDCQTDDFCAFAEYCQGGNCQTAWSNSTPYCKPCDGQFGNWDQCGASNDPAAALNRCLIYPYTGDAYAGRSDEYCSIDCASNDRCPSGFLCSEIIVIKTSDQCTRDSECPSGVPCWKSPEEDIGYCPCHASRNACPMDACDTFGLYGPPNTCVNLKTPCTSSADCVIPCVAEGADGFGGCVIGKNCGLMEGIHCPYPWPGHY